MIVESIASKNFNNTTKKTIQIPIDENLICLRSLNPKRTRFEVEYSLEKGSCTNSFLFNSFENENANSKHYILIHPPGLTFEKEFLEEFEKLISRDSCSIKLVMGHVNPNKVAFVKRMYEKYDNLTIICSNPGAKLFKEIWNQRKPTNQIDDKKRFETEEILPKIEIIKQIETWSFKNDFELTFIPAPTARWPGGLIVFERQTGLLMSDKLFGAHLYHEKWAELNSSSTEEERRHYFDCLMAPMSNQVNSIIEKFEEFEIDTIVPGHGPAISGSWRSLLNNYQSWGESQKYSNLRVALLFASAYGNTAAIADAIARGINKTGVNVKIINCEFTSSDSLITEIHKADGYLIGSPTLGGHAPTPIVSALGTLLAEGDRTKPAGVFGSYGWSGEALDLLEKKLKDGGFKFGFEPIKIKFSPDSLMIKKLEETGIQYGKKLINVKLRQERKANVGLNTSKNDPTINALGRVVGSLCILTAQKGNAENLLSGAMVASWVSQASFSPPGITIAVAKERAVENLLHTGDSFALNILEQNNHKSLLKQFLQAFKPGDNRFADIPIKFSPSKQPLLNEALAWLEGTVNQRMECGDHWLIYAEIKHGKVIQKDGITAVHHRKTGANY
tara:strand:+ start:243 stop:2093 length:1851 start_codon:yes stop_codon:yes gene_type:complete